MDRNPISLSPDAPPQSSSDTERSEGSGAAREEKESLEKGSLREWIDPLGKLLDGLEKKRLLIVSGKGGVGRSTVAAMLGAELAGRGGKTLVATTGQDDRLAWMFGQDFLDNHARLVGKNLWVQRLDPLRCVQDYASLVLPSSTLANYVLERSTVRRFLSAIPGFDDFAVLGKVWHEAARADEFDRVIFDGAASGHLKLALGVPRALAEVLPDSSLRREAESMEAFLKNGEKCAATFVGLPESWPLTELAELAANLHDEQGIRVAGILINRVRASIAFSAAARDRLGHSRVALEGNEEQQLVLNWLSKWQEKHYHVSLLPWFGASFEGVDSLHKWAEASQQLSEALPQEKAS